MLFRLQRLLCWALILCCAGAHGAALAGNVTTTPIDWYDQKKTHQSSGTGGTVPLPLSLLEERQDQPTPSGKALLFAETGVPVRLSDLFYDGFNYIAYINNYVATNYAIAEDGLQYLEQIEGDTVYSWTDHPLGWPLKRPFTGFPSDFPYFSVRVEDGGVLLVLLVYAIKTPFFSTGDDLSGTGIIAIPLLHGDSPYGQCSAMITRYEAYTPQGGEYLALMQHLTLDAGAYPKTDIAVREAVRDMITSLPEDMTCNDYDPGTHHSVWRHFLFISVCSFDGLSSSWDVTGASVIPRRSAIFDIHTGQVVSTDGWMEHFAGTAGTVTYRSKGSDYQISPGFWADNVLDEDGYPEDLEKVATPYQLPKGSQLNQVWLDKNPHVHIKNAGHYTVRDLPPHFVLDLREPDGKMVRIVVPAARLDEVLPE